jgi:hypothetical protein
MEEEKSGAHVSDFDFDFNSDFDHPPQLSTQVITKQSTKSTQISARYISLTRKYNP